MPTETTSIDGLLSKSIAKTTSLDGYLSEAATKAVSLDAILAITGVLSLIAPVPTVEIESRFILADLDFEAPAPQLEISDVLNVGVLNLEAPLPGIEIESKNILGVLSLNAPKPQIEFTGVKGFLDSLALIVPVPEIEIASTMGHSGTLEISAPVPQLEIIPLSGTYYCIVLNADNWVVSEYDNFDFDYLVKFKGNYYGANSTGIYLLDGAEKDNGANIAASFKTGLDDFGLGNLKKVDKLFVSLKSDGNTRLKIFGDEEDHSIANLESTGDVPKNRRVPINRRNKARFFNFEFSNVEGADFDLQGIEIFPRILGRRVDGS